MTAYAPPKVRPAVMAVAPRIGMVAGSYQRSGENMPAIAPSPINSTRIEKA